MKSTRAGDIDEDGDTDQGDLGLFLSLYQGALQLSD